MTDAQPGDRPRVYYNDSEPFVCAWLRNLMREGLIPAGDVDERPIQEVTPDDVRGYTQAHFFAGIGGWAYALRLAGWPDDLPVWTGSCPCPSFSSAGRGLGFTDPRHLWPSWEPLIRECRPPVVFGEQVAAAIGHGWLDLVSGDLEAQGYDVAAAVLGAHSAGAPHVRQRLFFVADTDRERREGLGLSVQRRGSHEEGEQTDGRGTPATVAHAPSNGREPRRPRDTPEVEARRQPHRSGQRRALLDPPEQWPIPGRRLEQPEARPAGRRVAEWPAEPRVGRVVDGLPKGVAGWRSASLARTCQLAGFGNAIIPETAQLFIEAYLDCVGTV